MLLQIFKFLRRKGDGMNFVDTLRDSTVIAFNTLFVFLFLCNRNCDFWCFVRFETL